MVYCSENSISENQNETSSAKDLKLNGVSPTPVPTVTTVFTPTIPLEDKVSMDKPVVPVVAPEKVDETFTADPILEKPNHAIVVKQFETVYGPNLDLKLSITEQCATRLLEKCEVLKAPNCT